jgi:putative ABC transport system permease protein
MFPEFVIDPEQWRAFLADRQGCVVGAATARRFGWKLGDRIPLKGTIFPGTWELNLRAIYEGRRPQDDTTQLWLRYDYLYEKAPSWIRGLVGWYWVRVSDPEAAVGVARTIDEGFANSPWETRTQTERAFAAAWLKQMGNIELLILSVGAVVLLTLLLVTGNTMAIALRERRCEIGVLKAIGYPDGLVLALVLAESTAVAVLGGGIGIGLAKLLVSRGDPTGGFLPVFYLSPTAIGIGMLGAACAGAVSGLLPAFAVMRLNVIQALRSA